MTVNVLFAARAERWAQYEVPLNRALAETGLDTALIHGAHQPDQIDYIVYAPNGDVQDFAPYTRCKAVLNLWAGVEDVVGNQTLTQPLARMVDPGLTDGMVEWCIGHLLRHHLGIDAHINGQDGVWRAGIVPPLAQDRKVTVLGLGELGRAVAEAAAALKFQVTGWSARPKSIAAVTCHAGPDDLTKALSGAEIVILLLPNTPETENTLNADTLGLLAPGAVLINPGRGPLIDDTALLAALTSGALGHATLDVFRVEPLPRDHPFWSHPRITVTPHIASETRADSASRVIAQNVARGEEGQPFLHLVDRRAGY